MREWVSRAWLLVLASVLAWTGIVRVPALPDAGSRSIQCCFLHGPELRYGLEVPAVLDALPTAETEVPTGEADGPSTVPRSVHIRSRWRSPSGKRPGEDATTRPTTALLALRANPATAPPSP